MCANIVIYLNFINQSYIYLVLILSAVKLPHLSQNKNKVARVKWFKYIFNIVTLFFYFDK